MEVVRGRLQIRDLRPIKPEDYQERDYDSGADKRTHRVDEPIRARLFDFSRIRQKIFHFSLALFLK